MPGIQVSERIRAPQEDVFHQCLQVDQWPDFCRQIKRVEVLSDGPIREGTRFRETRTMFGREASEEMEFTKIEHPRRYVVECTNHGCHYRVEFSFAQQGPETVVTSDFSATPLTFFARVMGTLMMPLMKGNMKKCVRQDLQDLKKKMEEGRR